MPVLIQIYLFSCVFAFLCMVNTTYITMSIAREYKRKFDKTRPSSIGKLLLICICPVLNILASIAWLFLPEERYIEVILENSYPADEEE